MCYRLSWIRNYSSVFSLAKTNMNLEKCYFRHIENENKIDITFVHKVKDTMKQFNFSRQPTETLQTLCTRIVANIQKFVNKANKKKTSNETKEIEVNLYGKDDILSHSITCLELFQLEGPLRLKIHDHTYELIFNAPWVLNVNLPQSILAGFPVYPENFTTLHTTEEDSVFKWYVGISVNDKGNDINILHITWDYVGTGFTYTPSSCDVGKKLKLECIPGNNKTIGPIVETISKNVIEAGPGKCPFETRHSFTVNKLNGQSFRCVTYNILANLYCDSDFTRSVLHPYCPPYALHIDYRKQLIIKELLGYNADIICLQEVDCKIFNNCLIPLLKTAGFTGSFYKKGKEVAEGLACFYRPKRYMFLGDNKIVLSEALKTEPYLARIWSAVQDNKKLTERLIDRSTVASATILQAVDTPNEILLIGNTHLYFHPDADHIRLIQGGIVIYWLNDMKVKLSEQFPGKRISLILCGDFNSVPSCGIYQLYTTGKSPSSLPDWSSNVEEAIHNLTLNQETSLKSACGTPQYTNFTAGFADCLDYIFYDNNNIEVEQVVPFPSHQELTANTALPSIVFPSDHIALISDLKFKLD